MLLQAEHLATTRIGVTMTSDNQKIAAKTKEPIDAGRDAMLNATARLGEQALLLTECNASEATSDANSGMESAVYDSLAQELARINSNK